MPRIPPPRSGASRRNLTANTTIPTASIACDCGRLLSSSRFRRTGSTGALPLPESPGFP